MGAILGTIYSIIIRSELDSSGSRIISSSSITSYNLVITLHAFLMIFFFIMPALFSAFGNYYVPSLIGSIELAYPRLNNLSLLVAVNSQTHMTTPTLIELNREGPG
jgi:cytochrome c oxidase subunit 1